MSLRKAFKTDESLEKSGIEYKTGGATFTLARAGGANTRYTKLMERLCKPYRRQIQTGHLDGETALDIALDAFSQAVCLGWDGVTMDDVDGSGDKSPAPYTPERFCTMMRQLPQLFAELQEVAGGYAAFLQDVAAADAGNL